MPLCAVTPHLSLSHTRAVTFDAGHVLYAQLEYLDSWLRRAELLFGIEYRRRSSNNGFPATASLWTNAPDWRSGRPWRLHAQAVRGPQPPRSGMQIQLRSGAEFYLDGLLVECILADLRARNLASVAMVCRSLRLPAQAAAYRALTRIVDRMQCKMMERYERGSSWIRKLREWEALDAANKVWLQAAAPNVVTVEKRGEGTLVKRVGDLSGNGYGATMHQQMPALRQNAINGHAAFEFDGHAVLKTIPFAEPMQQPVTLIVVARARGDTTIVDSLSPSCALPCHPLRTPCCVPRREPPPSNRPPPRYPAPRTHPQLHSTRLTRG